MKKILFIFILVLLLVVLGCDKNSGYTEYNENFESMDTQIFITFYKNKETKIDANDVLNEVKGIYLKYHNLTDKYNNHNVNGVYEINEKAGLEEVVVNDDLFELLKQSKLYYEKSNGAFNPAIGAISSVWHKYRTDCLENEICQVPSDEELESKSSLINTEDLIFNEERKSVFLQTEGMSLDLGGIAKGYATNKVAEYLKSVGIDKYIINAGGNVDTGLHPENRDWKIGLENPISIGEYYKVVELRNKSVVTSGDYQRYYEHEGIRYHHIIDTKTLKPLSLYKSVSVVCVNSGIADMLSTALYNLSIEEGQTVINKLDGDYKVYWYQADGELINYEKS